MLVATKITQKRNLAIFGLITLVALSGSIYIVYDNYVKNLDLKAPKSILKAYYGASGGILIEERKVVSEEESQISKIKKYFDIDLFYDQKYRSLRENTASDINISVGVKDPFKKFNE